MCKPFMGRYATSGETRKRGALWSFISQGVMGLYMYEALYICMCVYVCEWGFMGNAVRHFTRDFSPIAPAVVVWLGAMGCHEGFRRYLPLTTWSYVKLI
ncbi:hypothetical protein Hanom_Chr16g01467431 [Helianthus anomalus]